MLWATCRWLVRRFWHIIVPLKAAHKLNFNMLEALFADDSNWEMVEAVPSFRKSARVGGLTDKAAVRIALGPETN